MLQHRANNENEQTAIVPALTDIQETVRDQAQAPFPQPYDLPPDTKMYLMRRITLAAGQQAEFEVGFIPDAWNVYCKDGVATDGMYLSGQWQTTSAQLWLQSDKHLKLPGLTTKLFINADTANAGPLDIFVIATRNCEIDIG